MRHLLVFIVLILLSSCEERFMELEVGKKYVLIDKPDSAYIHWVDSVVAAEVAPKKKKTVGTTVKIEHGGNGSNTQVFTPEQFKKMFGSKPKNDNKHASSVKNPQAAGSEIPQIGQQVKSNENEIFLDNFSSQVKKIREDSENPKLVQVIVAEKKGLTSVLKQAYGSKANALPEILVRYQLKSINPGLDMNAIKAGDKVRVPKL